MHGLRMLPCSPLSGMAGFNSNSYFAGAVFAQSPPSAIAIDPVMVTSRPPRVAAARAPFAFADLTRRHARRRFDTSTLCRHAQAGSLSFIVVGGVGLGLRALPASRERAVAANN